MRITPSELTHLRTVRIWIAGAGKSGMGSAFLCKKWGLSAFLSDAGILSSDNRLLLTQQDIPFEDGGHSLDLFDAQCDLLVLSPTILLSQGLAIRARHKGIPVISEVELAAWFLPASTYICGITGTNGKSTTTHYLGQLFSRMGLVGIGCGNIGNPISVVAHDNEHTEHLALALELSSYQLETTYAVRPKAGILLNLQVDHQERYKNLDEYLKAKWRLLATLPPNGVAVVDGATLLHALRLGLTLPRCEIVVAQKETPAPVPPSPLQRLWDEAAALPLALYGDLSALTWQQLIAPAHTSSATYALREGKIYIDITMREKRVSFLIQEPCLPGEHNVQNLLAATVVALHAGATPDTVRAQWELCTTQYEHLAHRLEEVGGRAVKFRDSHGRAKQVRIINDSKATNVESVLVALRSFSVPVRLLIGGHSKGESYTPIAQHAKAPVVSYHPFGTAGTEVHAELAPLAQNTVRPPVATLLVAAQAALDEAHDGDIILLSPACASFDEFKNFEDRGCRFREWALTLREEKP